MSNNWERSPTGRSEAPREFLVSTELYVSTVAGVALRKPPTQRKKSDKRDSVKPLANSTEDSKKIKEKSSWLTLARGSTDTGHWRPATCKLSEEGERCLLNIYVDETILYQTIYIHLLNHTDIRQADSSLFLRKDCLGVYCIAGQRWSSTHTAEPVYIQFANSDACNTWLALLRSYAIPEIYGRWFFPTDGGSYRMWRQVELTVLQGRNLGNTKPYVEASGNAGVTGGPESNSEPDAVDLDVSCEIHLNSTLCGRTTVKKGIGSPDWHESFIFSDLPPFETLDIHVWREKKLFKPTIMGSVRITLSNFRRGEAVEGWFPVLHNGPVASDLQVGDIRLKIRVDEEIILPYSAYAGLLQTFNSRNFLDWMTEFESKLRLKTISTQLMSIAIAKNVLIDQVQELADREVDGTPSSHQTLFRGNTILTKIMELCMAWYGKAFLEASIGSVLRRLCAEKVAIEVDPIRSGKSTKDVERNVDQLISWCQEFWKQIYSVRAECPNEMRRLFEHIRKLVERKYKTRAASQDQNRDLPRQSVSAFCFLRFIVPAILHPHLFGLCPGLPSASVQRSLTLIAKVIQSLANLNATVQKEDFMRGVKDFLQESLPGMMDYIIVVSTPTNDAYSSHPGIVSDRHDRLNVVNCLRQRGSAMAVLEREAIPILPHLLDIPRHLAIITSAVIRNSRDYNSRSDSHEPGERILDEFCAKCFEVEEHALHRVSQLATRISSDRRWPSAASHSANSTPQSSSALSSGQRPDISPASSLCTPSTGQRRPRKSTRPSTAPSVSDTDVSRRHLLSDTSTPSSPSQMFTRDPQAIYTTGHPSSSEGERGTWSRRKHRLLHLKSTSTDSIPSYGLDSSSRLVIRPLVSADSPTDMSDDAGKRKKGLLRGILRR